MVNVPYSGHVNPTIPLTKEFIRRGHQVSYINVEAFQKNRDSIDASYEFIVSFIKNQSHLQAQF